MKFLSIKSIRHFLIIALYGAHGSPLSAHDDIWVETSKIMAVIAGGIFFFAIQRAAQKPLVWSSIARSEEFSSERSQALGDCKKAIELANIHKNNIQKLTKMLVDALALIPKDSEKSQLLHKWHAETLEELSKINTDQTPISEEDLVARFDEFNSLYENHFSSEIPFKQYFEKVVPDSTYENIIEAAKLSRKLNISLNQQNLQLKYREIDGQINEKIDQQTDRAIEEFERKNPMINIVFKQYPVIIATLGGAAIGGTDSFSSASNHGTDE